MNRKVLLGIVVALTLITAGIHLFLGGGMAFMRPPGGGQGGPPGGQNGGQGQPGGADQGGGQADAGQPPQPPGGGGPGGPGGGGMFMALPILFLLNGVGYLALLALIAFPVPYFKDHPALAHWLLIGFAAVTIVAYFAMNDLARLMGNPIALVAKVDELLLIVFAYLHLRAAQPGGAPAAPAAA